jgi:FixJ family two-component response regulator
MSANSDEKVCAQVPHAGAVGFLRKPFDDEFLIECLEKAHAGSKMGHGLSHISK